MAPRAPKQPSPPPTGWVGWTLQPDGTIDIPVAGQVYSLAAPTIGQLREIELAHAKIQATIAADLARLQEAKGDQGLDPVAIAEAKWARVDQIAGWWVGVVWPALGSGDPPAKDDLPPWMTVAVNTLGALMHWQSTPPVPGGN